MAKAGHTKTAKIRQKLTNGIYIVGAGKIPKKTLEKWNG